MEIVCLLPGQERFVPVRSKSGREMVEYSYCTERGELFQCVCRSKQEAYERCEMWMLRQERY